MDAALFNSLVKQIARTSPLTKEQVAVAKQVLVAGDSLPDVVKTVYGKSTKKSYLAGQLALDKLHKAFLKEKGLPPTWKMLTVAVPRAMVPAILALEKKAKAEHFAKFSKLKVIPAIADIALPKGKLPVKRKSKRPVTKTKLGSGLARSSGGRRINPKTGAVRKLPGKTSR